MTEVRRARERNASGEWMNVQVDRNMAEKLHLALLLR